MTQVHEMCELNTSIKRYGGMIMCRNLDTIFRAKYVPY